MVDGAAKRGRSGAAAIIRALKSALSAQQPLTYTELARAAGCCERTVRNYLSMSETALGFEVERSTGTNGVVVVRRTPEAAGPTSIQDLAHALAYDLLRRVFPVAGTDLEQTPKRRGPPILVFSRGAYQYKEEHLRGLRVWLNAAGASPRQVVRFTYDAASSGLGERIVWPVGVVLSGLSRVYLAGVPVEATGVRDLRTYSLEWVKSKTGGSLALAAEGSACDPPEGLEDVRIEGAINAPFGLYRPTPEDGVRVRVRFAHKTARYLRNRAWHKGQRVTDLGDGGVQYEFGPADLRDAAAWVLEWGDGIEVLGDEKLIQFLIRSHTGSLDKLQRQCRDP